MSTIGVLGILSFLIRLCCLSLYPILLNILLSMLFPLSFSPFNTCLNRFVSPFEIYQQFFTPLISFIITSVLIQELHHKSLEPTSYRRDDERVITFRICLVYIVRHPHPTRPTPSTSPLVDQGPHGFSCRV